MISVVVDTDRWIDSICESVADGFVWQEFEDAVWRCDDSLLVVYRCIMYAIYDDCSVIIMFLLCVDIVRMSAHVVKTSSVRSLQCVDVFELRKL